MPIELAHNMTFEIFFAAGCVTLNAFFVAAEFALVKVRGSRIQELVESGNKRALLVSHMLDDIDGYLSATQLGITLMSIGLGSVAEPALSRKLEAAFPAVFGASSVLKHTIAVFISYGLISAVHVVIGELVPRALAIRNAEKFILRLAPAFYLFRRIFRPFLWIFDRSAGLILRILGVKVGVRGHEKFSEEELRLVLMESMQKGSMSDAKLDLIDNVFDFSKRTAKHVMIARDDIVSLDINGNIEDNFEKAKANNHTRYPLCEGSIDHVVGLVNFKDVMWLSEEGRENLDFKKIRREILFVPENKPLTKLLKDFQRNKIHMAIVIDEFGVTSGVVTLEDVLEELVGEIQDEYDQEKNSIQLLRDSSYMIDGSTLIEEVEEKLGIQIKKEDNTTIAGAVLSELGRLPRVGDKVDFENFMFTVKGLKGRRINLLHAFKKPSL